MLRAHESIAVQGYTIPPKASVTLRVISKKRAPKFIGDGILIAHNPTDRPQHLYASTEARCRYPDETFTYPADDVDNACWPLGEGSNVLFEILQMPYKLTQGDRAMNKQDLDELLTPGSKWTMKDIITRVEPLPGSSYSKEGKWQQITLVFARTYWQVVQQNTLAPQTRYTACTAFLHPNRSFKRVRKYHEAYVFNDFQQEFTIVTYKVTPPQYERSNDSLEIFFDEIGTSGLVSLLQKAIRRRPARLEHPETGELYDTRQVIRRICKRMSMRVQPSFFLPHVRKSVTALQHFLKRLFTIAAEDSKYDIENMFHVSMATYLAEKVPYWTPDEELIEFWASFAVDLYDANVKSNYDSLTDQSPLPKANNWDEFKSYAPANIQLAIGGMKGDTNMLHHLARDESIHNTLGGQYEPVGVDLLDVYCDQHQDGRIVCFLEHGEAASVRAPYSNTLGDFFHALSGYNTRIHRRKSRRSQQSLWDALKANSRMNRGKGIELNRSPPTVAYNATLPAGALAGMVPPIKVNPHDSNPRIPKYMVTVDCTDIDKFKVIPNPKRDTKISQIDTGTRTKCILRAKEVLERGVRIQVPFDDSFKGKIIRKSVDHWYVGSVPWEQARQRCYTISQPSWRSIDAPKELLQWVASILRGFNEFSIPGINRVGEGSKQALTGLEANGFKLLLQLASMYPDALYPHARKPYTFITACPPLREELRKHIMLSKRVQCTLPPWNFPQDLYDAQKHAAEDMTRALENGYGSFLWMFVGQGKTLSVAKCLDNVRDFRRVFWCIPPEACDTVARQIQQIGWEPILLYGTKKSPNVSVATQGAVDEPLREGVVYLVFHDDLRRRRCDTRSVTDWLVPYMGDSVFVFDEVHKAMAGTTQRTALALRLASAAGYMIALTGTPIVDSKGFGLMEWLRMCVPFPLTLKNFWVGANSMISHLTLGDVVTHDTTHVEPPTAKEKRTLLQHYPSREPWNGHHADLCFSTQGYTICQRLSMDIATRGMIRKTVEIISHASNMSQTQAVAATREYTSSGVRASPYTDELFLSLPQNVLLVADTLKHAARMANELRTLMRPEDIIAVGGNRPQTLEEDVEHVKSMDLTEDMVFNGEKHPYRVVIVPICYGTGMTLTWCSVMIDACYHANQAKVTQMRGRINRLDCQRLHKTYIRVLGGMMEMTNEMKGNAKSIQNALVSGAVSNKRRRLS